MGKSLRVVLGSRRTPAAAAFWWWISSCLFTSPLLAASSYQIDTIAGTDAVGDNGPAGSASLLGAEGVCADTKGNIYVADTAGNRVRKIDPSGTITSIAGTGAAGFSGDGGPAALAQLQQPYGISVDPAGNLYIADLGNNRIRKVTPDGLIATFPTAPPILNSPRNVLADRAGNVYIAEFGGARICASMPAGRSPWWRGPATLASTPNRVRRPRRASTDPPACSSIPPACCISPIAATAASARWPTAP